MNMRRLLFLCLNQKIYEPCFQNILKDLKKRFPTEHFSIGIGKICQSLKHLNYAQEEALFAIKIGRKLYAQQRLHKEAVQARTGLRVRVFKGPQFPVVFPRAVESEL